MLAESVIIGDKTVEVHTGTIAEAHLVKTPAVCQLFHDNERVWQTYKYTDYDYAKLTFSVTACNYCITNESNSPIH